MRKSNGVFLAIATLIVSVLIWGNPIHRLIAAFSPPIPTPTTTAITPSAIDTATGKALVDLSVDEAQLMAHVNALAQPRFTDEEKKTARRYIIEQLTDYGLTPKEQRYESPEGSSTGSNVTSGINIIAELPGHTPIAGSIVLGAHYDTIQGSSGADDNGSAIATLLEAARLFSPNRPTARALKLVFFDQEEYQLEADTGLLGSLAFTQSEDDIAGVKGAVILDMVGYACRTAGCQRYPGRLPLPDVPDTGDFLAVLGLTSSANSPTHNMEANLLGAFRLSAQRHNPLVLMLPIPKPVLNLVPDLMRSDHAPFWERNIPAVFVTDTANFRNPHYHTEQDTPDTLDGSFFRGSAQHVINAITTLLNQ